MLKKWLVILALSVSTNAYAVTHIPTDTGVILDFQDNETEFVTYLINETINMYAPKQNINLELRELIYNNEIIMSIGAPNANFTIQSSLDIFDSNKPIGVLFGMEVKF